jgi:hypothetical protein
MVQSLPAAFLNLLKNPGLPDIEIRRLVGWHALCLTDLLQRECVTVGYAERILFNLDVVQQLEQRGLMDCVELIDWGMQLEDWADHTPDDIAEALVKVAQLAQQLFTMPLAPEVPSRSA